MRFARCVVLLLGVSLLAAPAAAQSRLPVVTLSADAPVFVTPNANQTPLRVGKQGSVLRLLDQTDEWVHIEFDDPQYGRRAGYVQMKFVRMQAPGAPTPTPPPTAPRVTSPPAAPPPAGPPAHTAPAARRVTFFGFGQAAYGTWLARQTFEAVLGSAHGPTFGGGGQVRVRDRFVIEGAIERFQKTGQRVFVYNGELFKLGIPDTVRILPVHVTALYRWPGGTVTPYGGGGIGQYFYKEEAPFADPSENLDQRFTSYQAVAGVEFGRRTSVIKTALEAQFRSVPGALGTSGASAAFGEHNLGGFQVQLKILAGR